MPNWVMNRVTFEGDPVRVHDLLEGIRPEGHPLGHIDFDRVLPMPASLDIESGSRTARGYSQYRRYIKAKDPFVRRACESYAANYPEEWALGKAAYQNEIDYGAQDWYEWRVLHWGTKWNAENENSAESTELRFRTAWICPVPVLVEIGRQFPDVEIFVEYADEDIGHNCGTITISEGSPYYAEPGNSNECVLFACGVWGSDPTDYGLFLNESGEYEYRDE